MGWQLYCHPSRGCGSPTAAPTPADLDGTDCPRLSGRRGDVVSVAWLGRRGHDVAVQAGPTGVGRLAGGIGSKSYRAQGSATDRAADMPVPRLLLSRHVPNAVAVGVLRPTIILPAALAENSSPPALRAVLAHEWAHIRNRDLWLLALGRCLLVVLFAHPLFWWLRRAIRGDQELLADAVAAGDNRQDYAEDLLAVDSQDNASLADGRLGGNGPLGRFLPAFKENCHASGRNVLRRADRLAPLEVPGFRRVGAFGRGLFARDFAARALSWSTASNGNFRRIETR